MKIVLGRRGKGLVADLALERLLPGVDPDMLLEVAILAEALLTIRTGEGTNA